jgi:glutamate 5-kinase
MAENTTHQHLTDKKRWVIKIGSALLTKDGEGLDRERVRWLSDEIAWLKSQGKEVVLVTSGSVAAGMQELGWIERPQELYQLQAAASVGQMDLIQAYAAAFKAHGIHTAQILLTHADLTDTERYANAQTVMMNLIKMGVVPVVNENDTIATEEIRFGDNDTLAAMTAGLVDADLLVILTDQDGLFDSDPRENTKARLIAGAPADDPALDAMASKGSGKLGRGGMATKLLAARRASVSGVDTIIMSGKQADNIRILFAGEQVGTLLWAGPQPGDSLN